MKSLWRRIGKKSLRLARRNGTGPNGQNGATPASTVAATLSLSVEETQPEGERSPCSKEEQELSPSATLAMNSVRNQVSGSFDKAIPEEEECVDEEDHAEGDDPDPAVLVPATSEENLDCENSPSYCYGTQFAFHGGLYGYPVAVVRRRLAAVPVIKGYTMTDVDFPLYFSSYDIPVVSASRHASFTRRHRLVRLHDRYASMPAMRTERSAPRAATLSAVDRSSTIKVAAPDQVVAEAGPQ